jgi:hypothetical protein
MHIARPGSARLETAEGVPVGNLWNIAHLRKFYHRFLTRIKDCCYSTLYQLKLLFSIDIKLKRIIAPLLWHDIKMA